MKKRILAPGIEDQIHHLEYKLLLNTPSLRYESLIHHLCMPNFLNEQKRLFKQLSQNSKNLTFGVISPNVYIQKIRAIYYLLLQQSYEHASGTFLRVFNLLRLSFYRKNNVKEVHKKFLAQFVQFIRYGQKKENVVKDNLNKYPIMDQILIDLLLSEIQVGEEGAKATLTPDDNYNIVNFLRRLGLACQAKTLWEITVQNLEIRVNEHSITIVKYQKENNFEQNVSTGAVSINESQGKDQLQFSNVFSFSDKVFDNMDKSFIEMLNSFIKEDEKQNSQQKMIKSKEKNNEEKMFKNLKKTLNPTVYQSTEFQKAPSLVQIEQEKKPNFIGIQNQSLQRKYKNHPDEHLNLNKTETKKQKIESRKIVSENQFFSPKNSPILKYRSTMRVLSPGPTAVPFTTTPPKKNESVKRIFIDYSQKF